MKYIYLLLGSLLVLIGVVLLAQIWSPVDFAFGYPHPEYKGMMISKANIDQQPHTRWLGILFGAGIIALFGSFMLIGNRKKGKLTGLGKYVIIGIGAYFLAYTGLVVSHWSYVANDGGAFFASMPIPTAWMIFGVWFVPLIITVSYILNFEKEIISENDIKEFQDFLESYKVEAKA